MHKPNATNVLDCKSVLRQINIKMKKLQLLIGILVFPFILLAQNHHERLATIDVQHYFFNLELSDASDEITGSALVKIRFRKPVDGFTLDLVKKDGDAGMTVNSVLEDGKKVDFQHAGAALQIKIGPTATNETRTYRIDYQGIPTDGLVIGKNKFGSRTFFGDNWPDRANHWLPTVDHPSDKASVEFVVTAPEHYQVIANGLQIEETNLPDGKKLTHWSESVLLPTKVMVIGVASFAVQWAGETHDIPVTSWVFPENRQAGFYDYAQAVSVLDWFIDHIAPYPYQKLANVQSKTRYGGMENASNIFYFENSVTGNREREALIAHEIAHQWFGNSASEANWHHVWLSEGFATYTTDLYFESVYGRDDFVERMESERQQVIAFANRRLVPIVDTTIENYNQVLNANSYQKGAWVLHMLRHEVGDEAFWKGIRTYYDRYKYSNALTDDLREVMEEVSGKNLKGFFQQWIFQPGHPKLQINWSYDAAKKEVNLSLEQTQKDVLFQFPLDVAMGSQMETIKVNQRNQQFSIKVEEAPTELRVDPKVWLLMEAKIEQKP